ncbi:imidazole glycerol phosphate synthase subunit HisH [Xanthovirga aplysinae]|uniref:imidazole glycerol phosphate synthase subunit HisH n=1 Tax=Xanthovirga aplysinae TaxID=2529853 RepID=UPI0012BCD139|nr:imidazole glycerol phosphate synthase subunit HisH [Xanthovirga aplysinae]MTI32220.1 imidazole glycerol phosphate synthase subunit HisH [Xanthovirga aplysinae]
MIAIVKYNAGNTRSVTNTLNRLNVEPVLTDDPELLRQADKVIFPGVGEASSAMNYLRERGLDQVLKNLRQPFLGICVGMQLMCNHSEEGNCELMGIFEENVRKFPVEKGKVPHMGWNNFTSCKGKLFQGISSDEDVYFVHSYYAETGAQTVATSEYLLPFSAALHKDNFYAVQFHPEKSAGIGQKMLQNFLNIKN